MRFAVQEAIIKLNKNILRWTTTHCILHSVIYLTKLNQNAEAVSVKVHPMIQQLVELPLAQITWNNWFLYDVISFSCCCGRIFGPLFFIALLQLIEVCSISLWTALLRSQHSISNRWSSGLWLDHCDTLIIFFFRHSDVDLLPCLGSLSCWWASFSQALAVGQLVWGVCADMLCLVSYKRAAVHHDQTSPLWSGLSKGHCSRSLVLCSDAALQT